MKKAKSNSPTPKTTNGIGSGLQFYKPNWNFSSTSLRPEQTPLSRTDGKQSILPETPTLFYTEAAWLKIDYIVQKAPKEIGWFGTVEKIDGAVYLVKDIYIPQQTVRSVETDIEESAMAELAMEIMEAGGDPSELRYWGHSHVNMGVSPSMQDENQVDEYLDHVDFFIRGIYNKQGAAKVDFYDTEAGIVFQCIDNEVLGSELTKEAKRELDKILKDKVVNQVYSVPGAWNSRKKNGAVSGNTATLPATSTVVGTLDDDDDQDLNAIMAAHHYGNIQDDTPHDPYAEILELYHEGTGRDELLQLYPGNARDINSLFDPFYYSED